MRVSISSNVPYWPDPGVDLELWSSVVSDAVLHWEPNSVDLRLAKLGYPWRLRSGTVLALEQMYPEPAAYQLAFAAAIETARIMDRRDEIRSRLNVLVDDAVEAALLAEARSRCPLSHEEGRFCPLCTM